MRDPITPLQTSFLEENSEIRQTRDSSVAPFTESTLFIFFGVVVNC